MLFFGVLVLGLMILSGCAVNIEGIDKLEKAIKNIEVHDVNGYGTVIVITTEGGGKAVFGMPSVPGCPPSWGTNVDVFSAELCQSLTASEPSRVPVSEPSEPEVLEGEYEKCIEEGMKMTHGLLPEERAIAEKEVLLRCERLLR